MSNDFNFFTGVPIELRINILSKLPLKKLMEYHLISKRQRMYADLTLFSMNDAEAIWYQSKLLA